MKKRKGDTPHDKEKDTIDSIIEERIKEAEQSNKTILELLNELKSEIKTRKESELALAMSENKCRSYIENAPFAIFVVDENGKYIETNLAANNITGYSPEEIIGKHITDFIPAEDHHLVAQHFGAVVEKGEASVNVRYIRKDGEIRYWEVKAVKLSENRFLGFKSDITDKKNYEHNLKASEERFKSLFEYNPGAIFVWVYKDGHFTLSMVNNTANAITENCASDFIGSKARELYKDMPVMIQKINECFRTQKTIEFEHHYKTRYSDKYEWVHFKFAFMSPDTVLMFSETITQRKLAEQELIKAKEEAEKREKEYLDLVQSLGEGHLKADKEGFIIMANQPVADMCGYSSPDEMMGLHMKSLYKNPADRDEMLNQIKRKGVLENYEVMLKGKDGSSFWTISNIRILYNDKGEIAGTEGLIRNMNDLKITQQALKESEEKYRLIAENTSDGIIVFDPSNKITYASPSYYTQFGSTPEETLQQGKESVYQLIYPEDRDILFANIFKAIDQKKSDLIYTYRFKKTEKEYIWREDHAKFKYDNDGNYLGANVICRDITERKLAENAKRDMEIAGQTIKFKQNFLANMSHEIRTPLTGVLGMIDALEETELSQKQKDYISTLKLSGDNLKEIIDQVLDYSKIEAGKVTLKPAAFEFRALPELAKMLYKNNMREGVHIFTKTDSRIPDFLIADKYRLSQIINNLVSNAIKFTSKGSIGIIASLLTYNDKTNDTSIKIEVTDTGIGIHDELLKNLFAPFSQIEDKDMGYYEGTGLGLSICKELVKLMNGDIGVISKPNEGSTFWFTFTAKKTETAKGNIFTHPSDLPQKELRILFAEDKIVNQKVVNIMLQSLGHRVSIVNNGQEALNIFQPGTFDLILMDIQMPMMDGVTATQKLKEKYHDLPPIVGLSANAFEGDREKYMAMGMDEYLTKPVKKEDFEGLIKKLIV
jgi:PAS domain S-box-containing protein